MEKQLGLCPSCNQQIEVNPSESVDFCPSCGKPYSAQAAISLYKENETKRIELDAKREAERIWREKNGRKPSDEIIEKFNAIGAENCDLAKQYLDDILKKEYPTMPIPSFGIFDSLDYFSTYLKSNADRRYTWAYIRSSNAWKRVEGDITTLESILNELRSVNPWIAEMYYKVLCAKTSIYSPLIKTSTCPHFSLSGGLPLLKLSFFYLDKNLTYIGEEMHGYTRRPDYLKEDSDLKGIIAAWIQLEAEITHFDYLRGKEFNDAYINALTSSFRWTGDYQRRFLYGGYTSLAGAINEFLSEQKVNCRFRTYGALVGYIESFLSPEGVKQREERKEQERQAKAAAMKLEAATAFWKTYIDLLKAGKIKKAQAWLETTQNRTEAYEAEAPKFKKGVFGVKYMGDIASLKADELATLELKNLI